MGRIRPNFVKRQAQQILATHINKFVTNFDENKKILTEIAVFPTKKLRNLIAGYITKELKKQNKKMVFVEDENENKEV
ncbi:MAG: 30S ribosomal protein S17e [Candidatus Nanoarchaeia archaeon]